MPYPIPTLEELTRSQESRLEAALQRHATDEGLAVTSGAIARAVRTPRGVFSAIVRNNAQLLWGAHLHLGWVGRQVLPQTADADTLLEHADTWGVFRRAPTLAIGRVALAGTPALAIPAGLELRAPTGAILATTTAGALDGTGSGTFEVQAQAPGPDGNVVAGTVLPLVSPLAGLDPQSATVDADGVAGGADLETAAALLDRLLARIRRPPHGGAAFDYPTWVLNEFAASHVAVRPLFNGPGTVGVVVAMGTRTAPRPPTPTEIEAIGRHLGQINGPQGERPVTADVTVLGATLVQLPLTLEVEPDTPGVRAAIATAHAAFLAREAEIGEPVSFSRLSEAISSAVGEYRHVLMYPTRDVSFGPLELPTPGSITWVAA